MLIPVAFLALAAVADHRPAPPARTIEVATCGVADGRSAKVTRTSNRYTYTFGKTGHPEIRLGPDPAANAVFKNADMFPRAGLTQLRFSNGMTSYVLFHYFNLGNYVRDYEGATEVDGLLVLQGGRRIAGYLCKSGNGLEEVDDLGPLPDDPLDLLDDVLAIVDRKPILTTREKGSRHSLARRSQVAGN